MFDGLRQTRLQAARAGPIAAQALSDGATGRVHSLFEHSAYLFIRSQLVCIGPSALGNGPLNLLCETWPSGGARHAALRVCDPVRADRHLVQVGRALTVSLTGAEVWNPKPIGEWDRHRLSVGLDALDDALSETLLEHGLAPLLRASREGLDNEPLVVRVGRAAAQELGCWVAKGMAGWPHEVDTETIASLIGLGPGLTPSGDDFRGVALIALSLLRANALRLSLWQRLQPLLPALSNDISAAHLAAAASGLFGSDALHDLPWAQVERGVGPGRRPHQCLLRCKDQNLAHLCLCMLSDTAVRALIAQVDLLPVDLGPARANTGERVWHCASEAPCAELRAVRQ